ncbi:primosomal protein N' [Candidatus Saccharibacteria bacterium]|nr:primosomal protein N' [Candidatus Saccharibacteria bacterium]
MYYEVVPEGKVGVLTYDFGDSLLPGQIVLVPIGKRAVPGIVVKKVAQPKFKTKSILKILYSKPLPEHLLKVIGFLHDYYLAPSGQAVSLILPRGVQKKRRKTEQMFGTAGSDNSSALEPTRPPVFTGGSFCRRRLGDGEHALESDELPEIPLNPHQKRALEALTRPPEGTKLLRGITGSGKTNVYLKMALDAFKQQKSSIILVPEIALTGQLVKVFQEVFDENIVLIHSKQTEAERHLIFNSLLNTDAPKIIIGPRSALFAPVSNLGLIVIDEEHETSYYQENAPRYSSVRVASFVAKNAGVPLILGSATPTIEDFYLAKQRGSLVKLEKKAKASKRPEIKIIDLKNREEFSKNRYFSNSLLRAITRNLEAGRQTLIFHNRRGSSPLTICEECGEEILCPNCYLPLTLHADNYVLQCHTCGVSGKVPTNCPKCGAVGMVHKGFGTKLLEAELSKLFPKARVRRFDADNKKGEGLEAVFDEVRDGEVDILVGTQTLAKGLDLPKLATVGVVQADAGLLLPDFMAEERTFQLLTQVIGRVGRGHLEKDEVFIQTFRPDHPVLKFAAEEDYLGFTEYMLKKRKKAKFPPFAFIAKVEITLKTESLVIKRIKEVVVKLEKNSKLFVSPPRPAFHERNSRGYTWETIIRSHSRKSLVDAVMNLEASFKVTLDPPGLL